MPFIPRETRNGWVVEFVVRDVDNNYHTASLRWRSKTEKLDPAEFQHTYEAAQFVADKKNGVTRKREIT